jgi:hypothetical protein
MIGYSSASRTGLIHAVNEEERGLLSWGQNPINKFRGKKTDALFLVALSARNKYFYPGHK